MLIFCDFLKYIVGNESGWRILFSGSVQSLARYSNMSMFFLHIQNEYTLKKLILPCQRKLLLEPWLGFIFCSMLLFFGNATKKIVFYATASKVLWHSVYWSGNLGQYNWLQRFYVDCEILYEYTWDFSGTE